MKKLQVRTIGPVRLTSAAIGCYNCACCNCSAM